MEWRRHHPAAQVSTLGELGHSILLSGLNHSIIQFSAPSKKIRSGTISISARICQRGVLSEKLVPISGVGGLCVFLRCSGNPPRD